MKYIVEYQNKHNMWIDSGVELKGVKAVEIYFSRLWGNHQLEWRSGSQFKLLDDEYVHRIAYGSGKNKGKEFNGRK